MANAPEHERPRVAILTLGCPKNLVDSEHIASLLDAAGVEVCTDATEAPVVIVNTCGFIESAKSESIDTILEIADLKASGLETLIVTGCLSQRYGTEIRELLPEVDCLLGIDGRGAAQAALRALGMGSALPSRCNLRAHRFTPRAWAYLRIADGCDNCCTYCAIPSIRGLLESRPMPEVLAEARDLLEGGVRELNIIAQDTTAYGMGGTQSQQLDELLLQICGLGCDKWIRLLYTHPAHYYPELIDVLTFDQICPYLDIPLQHVNDRILQRMGRKVTRREIEGLIAELRGRIPGLTLRTTFMVGFPGETDRQFEELLDFVRKMEFDRLGAFAYSREEGTRAGRYRNQIPEQVKQERLHELMIAQQKIAFRLAAARKGERTAVLVERAAAREAEPAVARSPHEAPDVDPVVLVEEAPHLRPGDIVDVEIVGGSGYDCVARICE